MQKISYTIAGQGGETLAFSTDLTEKVILTVSDLRQLEKSQLSAYWDISLGNHTSMKLRYYFTPTYNGASTIWYQVPAKNVATGVLGDIPSVADSTSPTNSSKLRFVEDFGVSGAVAFKVTVQGVGGSAGTVNGLNVMLRDN